ncbi:MAG: S41 family peptidase [Oscillospiraceae bacterium]|nr:S41 family peptidase [Oscillospiraceae bacterium]
MKKRFNIATIAGIMILVAALTFTITFLSVENIFAAQLSSEKDKSAYLQKLADIHDIITNYYVGEYDDEALADGAADGMVAATGDRWSFYMSAKNYADYQLSMRNEQIGIGVTVVYDEEGGALTVAKVNAGSPAETAGLKKYDKILSVDGELVKDIGYQATVMKVRGEEDTEVTLGVISRGEDTPRNVNVMRKSYLINAVTSEILEGNVGYVKIDNFDSRVDINFTDAVAKLLEAGVEGFVFDVRDNPGGMKDVMVSMLDLLCPQGVLFTMRDKHGNASVDHSDENEIDLPMTVIINSNSYSAAEFFAAALQEYGKASVIGTATTGKGYSQVTKPLSDGSAINISTNEYFTPNGVSLIGTGVTPDYEVKLNFEGNYLMLEHSEDNQLQKAIEVLKTEIITYEAKRAEG